MTTPGNSYDAVPYISEPFRQSQPDHLAAVACLLGLVPPEVATARVLELGCASGGNLIPLSITLPHARLLGIDYSERQIAEGQQTIDALGLRNVELRTASILDIGPELGTFDYIIAHGVYSWVPAEVQARMLDLAGMLLAPNGVAYISFNVLPGWYTHRGLREALLYHGRRFPDPTVRLRQSRAMLQFLADFSQVDEGPHRQFLQAEIASLQKLADPYLFHDHLEEQNIPVYFHEFMEQAQARGLRYLGDADFHAMFVENFPPPAQQVLKHIARSRVECEQYMDFLRQRMFRQTLLCRGSQSPDFDFQADRMSRLRVLSRLRPEAPFEALAGPDAVQFTTAKGLGITLDHPFLKTSLGLLAESWPVALPFDEVCREARARLPSAAVTPDQAGEDRQHLAVALMQLYRQSSVDWVEFSHAPPRAHAAGGDRPLASPLARYQARRGPMVTTLRHETVRLDELARATLLLLDGERDRSALAVALTEQHRQQPLTLPTRSTEHADMPEEQWLTVCLDGTLRELAGAALLLKPETA
jgi:methyltransferase-like protein